MPTNRIPIRRPPRTPRFTPAALEAFRQMVAFPQVDERWWHFHSILRTELQLKPWQFPCVRRPDPNHPSVHDPRKGWDHLDAENLYRELEAELLKQQEPV